MRALPHLVDEGVLGSGVSLSVNLLAQPRTNYSAHANTDLAGFANCICGNNRVWEGMLSAKQTG